MGSEAAIIWSLLFSSIGLGYFIYGKRQRHPVALVCGVGLMVFPYFVSNTLLLVVAGGLLLGLPYFINF